MHKIAVLTSGGDAPGMNPAVRAVVRVGLRQGLEVVAVRGGIKGLHEGAFLPMERSSVSNIIQRGGTIIYSSRYPEFKKPEVRAESVAKLREHGIEGLVVIGGDGSFHAAELLVQEFGFPVVGLPGTIDNDLYGTDFTIGYDTAMNTALDAIDKIRDTAQAMERVFFIEVMGRHAGYLALELAVAGGVDAVLLPEVETDFEVMAKTLQDCFNAGRDTVMVVVAEGDQTGGATLAAEKIRELLDVKSYVAILGYIQRGGNPTARDRVLASKLGAAAVEALVHGKSGVMLGEVNGEVVETRFPETWSKRKPLDHRLLDLLNL